MMLVDTSIWINYFNGIESKETDLLDISLIDGSVIIGDIIVMEILQGFRSDKDYNKAKKSLSTLEQYEMFGNNMVFKCANNYRALKKRGITIRKTADVIIASFCIDNKIPLLFSDRDFMPFVKHLNLLSVLNETEEKQSSARAEKSEF
ncbi:MAG: PIN domain nuclease [gamma proteobacterium symbiont of Taylorina sp.]|nr:PIN domain nuclease [gamma proteobacterium symbiont of Taylorina sp.]